MPDPVKFTLEIEKGEHGLWYVTSPEIRGLLVASPEIREIGFLVADALKGLGTAGDETCQELTRADRDEGWRP